MEELRAIPQTRPGRQGGTVAVPRRGQVMRAAVRSVTSGSSLIVQKTVRGVLDHDCLNLAQSSAYSAIVALFPTLPTPFRMMTCGRGSKRPSVALRSCWWLSSGTAFLGRAALG